MTILLVEVDKTTQAFLEQNHIVCEFVKYDENFDFEDYLTQGDLYEGAILNLDVGIGPYICRSLRKKGIKSALIGICSSVDNFSEKRAEFLENGGDDLLRHPVNPRELSASVDACTRRAKGSLSSISTFVLNNTTLKINKSLLSVSINNRKVYLTKTLCSLLFFLTDSPNKVISKEQIMFYLYSASNENEPEIKIVDVWICKIRNLFKQASPGSEDFIQTVWGRGYSFQPQQYSKETQ